MAVSDPEMVAGMRELGRYEGISAAPEGGAALQAVKILVADGRIKQGDLVMLEAMGGGFTWGSALLRW